MPTEMLPPQKQKHYHRSIFTMFDARDVCVCVCVRVIRLDFRPRETDVYAIFLRKQHPTTGDSKPHIAHTHTHKLSLDPVSSISQPALATVLSSVYV